MFTNVEQAPLGRILPGSAPFPSALIVGAGLIGTSLGLALRNAGADVLFQDSNASNAALANDLVGSASISGGEIESPALIVVATPISAIPALVSDLLNKYQNSIVMDVGGLKSKVHNELKELTVNLAHYVSVHPMAGREVSGPGAARADLFEGRAWIVTPAQGSSERAVAAARSLGEVTGSTVYELDAQAHDEAMALVSHFPQMVASLLGSTLARSIGNQAAEEQLALAGQGLRDTSRLAASDSAFWSELLIANSLVDAALLRNLAEEAIELATALESGRAEKVRSILDTGRAGQAKIPGKHGAKARDYTYLPVVINDAPGQLALLFEECARAGVNVEDLSIEHSPGQATGLITLALSEQDAFTLQKHLTTTGWSAHIPRK